MSVVEANERNLSPCIHPFISEPHSFSPLSMNIGGILLPSPPFTCLLHFCGNAAISWFFTDVLYKWLIMLHGAVDSLKVQGLHYSNQGD